MKQKKTTRLHFSEEDMKKPSVKKAASKAEAAADRADRAKERLPVKRKKRLRFEETAAEKPSSLSRKLTHAPGDVLSSQLHQQIGRSNEDENTGVEAAHFAEGSTEGAVRMAGYAGYSRKLKQFEKAEKLERKADAANVEALYQKFAADHPESISNPFSKWRQKQAIKKEYAVMKAAQGTAQSGSAASGTLSGAKKAGDGARNVTEKMIAFVKEHSYILLLILAAGLLLLVIAGMVSSCSVMMNSGGNVILGTSYTAEDADILGADGDYTALENELRRQIDSIESTHSGYDEYRYNLAEIGHNPYELAALLTVEFEDYTRAEVQAELQRIFEAQYELTLTEEVEIRTRTETRTGTSTSIDPVTGDTTTEEYEYEVEVEYEYYILHVTLTNSGVNQVARNSGLDSDQLERYDVLLETRGNRDDLFGDVSFAVPGGEYTDYDIPGEALTDERFRKMITEAEKYLGLPYVWGGSSPSTSFDCSGFVSYVINNCGNGWSVGRQTANGLMGCCDIIPRSEAKPGDLIFFQGTYNTSGASHVGIYVGNGMMIHCGNVRPARAKVEVD